MNSDYPGLNLLNDEMKKASATAVDAQSDDRNQAISKVRSKLPPSLNELVCANQAMLGRLSQQVDRVHSRNHRLIGPGPIALEPGNAPDTDDTIAATLWRQNTRALYLIEQLTWANDRGEAVG